MSTLSLARSIALVLLVFASHSMIDLHAETPEVVFPGESWQVRAPREMGLDPVKLQEFADAVGGDGVVVRHGYMVKNWGEPNRKKDWASAAKPVLSTLLLFAINEGRLASADEVIRPWVRQCWPGKDLIEKDRAITFRHLADMTSGYARGESPGSHWAYNDFAINLYQHVLAKVLNDSLNDAALSRLKPLQFEDGDIFGSRDGAGVRASPRDFARIGWFWLNQGRWAGHQLLPEASFSASLKADVPRNLPRTMKEGQDYLGIGSYGGGTDQDFPGQGVYGFNWWFNGSMAGRDEPFLPHLPKDAFAAIGHRGKEVMLVIPSLQLVVAARGDWGEVRLAKTKSLIEAVADKAARSTLPAPGD